MHTKLPEAQVIKTPVADGGKIHVNIDNFNNKQ